MKGRTARTLLFGVLMTLASQAGSEAVSDMLVCNPNDRTAEPVIYSFDGELLLRDNNPKFPYKNILTIDKNVYLYFGFEIPKYKMATLEREYKKYEEMKASSWKTVAEINNFKRYCEGAPDDHTYHNFSFFKSVQKSLQDSKQCIDYLTKENRCISITFVDVKLRSYERCSDISGIADRYLNFKEPAVTLSDFDQVKLTINLDVMQVIEERIFSDGSGFKAERFVCKSLGMSPPEIDRSQSITPILLDI